MAKRHTIEIQQWDSVFRRLDELCHANSISDSFWPVLKLSISLVMGVPDEASKGNSFELVRSIRDVNKVLEYIDKNWPGTIPEKPKHFEMSESLFESCMHELKQIDFQNANLEFMDSLFERLMQRSNKGEKGQFFTPRHVVEACVRVAQTKSTHQVADIACGSGAFLTKSIQLQDNVEVNFPDTNVWGFDIDLKAMAVAKLSLIALGRNPDQIIFADSLVKNGTKNLGANANRISIEGIMLQMLPTFEGFDFILTNPPFAGEFTDQEALEAYKLYRPGRKNERDVLFIERSVDLLKPGGVLAIVVPTNKLGGAQFEFVREFILKSMRVFGVLSLPRETFTPHTAQKTEIIFAVKRDQPLVSVDVTEEIVFVISEKPGKDKRGNFIFREGQSLNGNAWDSLDHDLQDAMPVLVAAKDKALAEMGFER